MKSMNPYATLNVGREASSEEIKKAYRKLALKFHPDTSDDSDKAGEKFKEINDAYSILKDPEKRRAYDLRREPGRRGYDAAGGGGRSVGVGVTSTECSNFECKRQHGIGRCFSTGGGGTGMAFRHPFSKYHSDRGDIYVIHLTKEEASRGVEKNVTIHTGSKSGSVYVRTQSGLNDGDTLIMKGGNPWRRGGDIYLRVSVIT